MLTISTLNSWLLTIAIVYHVVNVNHVVNINHFNLPIGKRTYVLFTMWLIKNVSRETCFIIYHVVNNRTYV